MRFVIVTGISGAGRSTALRTLEDLGFFCVDNIPVPLIPKFLEIALLPESGLEQIAVGCDIRGYLLSPDFAETLTDLKEENPQIEVLFMDASDACLIKRYKETRRSHPLAGEGRIEDGITEERTHLKPVRAMADYVIDTTTMLTKELRTELIRIFKDGDEYQNLFVTIVSFGFKYGIPADCDLVFDVRFLPNPYYVENLRHHTGNDREVRDFVRQDGKADEFLAKLVDMLEFLIPNYIKEGKNQLVIGIGCTGGKHRSVTIANGLEKEMRRHPEFGLKLEHRDITRG